MDRAFITGASIFQKIEYYIQKEPSQSLKKFGEVQSLSFPKSKLYFSCSSKEFILTTSDNLRFLPDVEIEQSFSDYINGIDPLYEYIRQLKTR